MKRVEEVAMETNVTLALPSAAVEAPKSDSGFHPAVAALRAELSNRGRSLGSMPVPSSEQVKPTLTLQAQDRRPATVPRPATIYPFDSSPRPVSPRPPMTFPAMPVQREDGSGQVGTQPRTQIAPATPRNVTTVITGIIPSKKKGTEEPSKEQASS